MGNIWAPSDILVHHGILGQKWGKKNGPPYPLGSGDHSVSEKKAGWRSSLKEKKKVKNFSKSIDTSKNKNPGKMTSDVAKDIATKKFKQNYISNDQINRVVSARNKWKETAKVSDKEKDLLKQIDEESWKLIKENYDEYEKRAIDEDVKEIGGKEAWIKEYGYDPYDKAYSDWVFNAALDIAYDDVLSKYPDLKNRQKKVDRAVSEYMKVTREVTDEIISEYGDQKVKDSNYGDYGVYISEIVNKLSEEDLH